MRRPTKPMLPESRGSSLPPQLLGLEVSSSPYAENRSTQALVPSLPIFVEIPSF
jgi:hypothetical protein